MDQYVDQVRNHHSASSTERGPPSSLLHQYICAVRGRVAQAPSRLGQHLCHVPPQLSFRLVCAHLSLHCLPPSCRVSLRPWVGLHWGWKCGWLPVSSWLAQRNATAKLMGSGRGKEKTQGRGTSHHPQAWRCGKREPALLLPLLALPALLPLHTPSCQSTSSQPVGCNRQL